MAKLTGQFTTPSLDAQNNKIHKPLLHRVVFVFTGATKVTRETDAKGKYSFDLANGEYEVSVYLKGNTEKDRFDMRAGEKFTVTATTQADALEKWLQVIGTGGKDELATYYENLLAQMQKIANDFKKDTEFVGTGKIVRDSVTNDKADKFIRYLADEHINNANEVGKYSTSSARYVNVTNGYPEELSSPAVITVSLWGSNVLLQTLQTQEFTFARRYDIRVPENVSWVKVATKGAMGVGDFGIGTSKLNTVNADLEFFKNMKTGGRYFINNGSPLMPRSGWFMLSALSTRSTYGQFDMLATSLSDKNLFHAFMGDDHIPVWHKIYSQINTTIDSNGFIKAASPIIKLFKDRIEHSGFGDNEPIFEKLGIGQYKISNTLGLAQEGWTYEKPRGNDGQPYFRIVVEKLEDGCIVRVHDEYDTVEKAEITDIDGNTRTVDKIVKILGQARDIKEHERWIDLRFHEEIEEVE